MKLNLYHFFGGHHFLHAEVSDLPHCPNPGCQVMVSENQWEEEEWMMSYSRTCQSRHEHSNFIRKFRGGLEECNFLLPYITSLI
jgi:hypothetical protein